MGVPREGSRDGDKDRGVWAAGGVGEGVVVEGKEGGERG